MSSDTAKRMGARRGTDSYWLPTDKFILVTDPDDPSGLFDERALQKPPAWLKTSILEFGQREPIKVKDYGPKGGPPILKIAAGRNRYNAICKINEEAIAEHGKKAELLDVWYVVVPREIEADDVMLCDNAQTKSPPLRDARIAKRYLVRHGYNPKQPPEEQDVCTRVCVGMGKTWKTISRWLDILTMHPAILAAIENKVLSENKAYAMLQKHGYDAQPRALERLLAPREKAAAREAPSRRLMPKRHVLALHDELVKEAEMRKALGTDAPEVHVDGLVNPLDVFRLLAGDMSVLAKPGMADVKRLAVEVGIVKQRKGTGDAATK